MLCQFETANASLLTTQAPTRYAVRQVLGQELRRVIGLRESDARQARFRAGARAGEDENLYDLQQAAQQKEKDLKNTKLLPATTVRRDFFGRVLTECARGPGEPSGNTSGNTVWVTFNEGQNNAVKKPIAFDEFMRGF